MECIEPVLDFLSQLVAALIGAFAGAYGAYRLNRIQKSHDEDAAALQVLTNSFYNVSTNHTVLAQVKGQLAEANQKNAGIDEDVRPLTTLFFVDDSVSIATDAIAPILFHIKREMISEMRRAQMAFSNCMALVHARNNWIEARLQAESRSDTHEAYLQILRSRVFQADAILPGQLDDTEKQLKTIASNLRDIVLQRYGLVLPVIDEQ